MSYEVKTVDNNELVNLSTEQQVLIDEYVSSMVARDKYRKLMFENQMNMTRLESKIRAEIPELDNGNWKLEVTNKS